MKAILMSIRPKWCEKIFNGSKSIEIRKSRPSIPTPFKVYVYMTKRKWIFKLLPFLKNRFAKGIGEFICDKVDAYTFSNYEAQYRINDVDLMKTCLNFPELIAYGKGKTIYGWHISEPKLFDKPKELREFSKFGYKYLGGCCVNYKCSNCIDNGWMQPPECKIDGCFLTRPPMSWCYIETDANQ